MRLLGFDKITPDMKLAKSIYRAGGDLLLGKGSNLTEEYLTRLKDFGYNALYVEDGILEDVMIEEVVSEQTKTKAIACVNEIMHKLQTNNKIKTKSIHNSVANIVDEIIDNKQTMISLSHIFSYDEYTFNHSVNVTIIAVFIGMSMHYSREKLIDLGMGVILHDLGKTFIPAAIVNKPGKLTEEEYELVKQHTWHGFDLLRETMYIKVTSAHVALQHHESFEGSGYPRGLKGKDILEFARICSIADAFDAMTSDRVYRPKFPVHEVYEYLIQNSGILFDPIILNYFIQKVAVYPKGTKIRLNDEQTGFVIDQNHMYPKSPVVRIFWQDAVILEKPVEIDLSKKPDLYIVDVIED